MMTPKDFKIKIDWHRLREQVIRFYDLLKRSIRPQLSSLQSQLVQHPHFFLGVEFASGGIKMIRSRESGGVFELMEAKTIPLNIEDYSKPRDQFWMESFEKLIGQNDAKTHELVISVNGAQTHFAEFTLPKIPTKEILDTLKWKIKDEISFPVDEAVIDYRLVDLPGDDEEARVMALVVAHAKPIASKITDKITALGFTSFRTAYANFSVDSLTKSLDLDTRHLVAIIDIGHTLTEIALYVGGRLDFLRKISFGSYQISKCLTEPLLTERGKVSLTLDEAEQVKRKEDLFDGKSRHLVMGKIEALKLHPLIRPELEKLANEIRRSFDYYTQANGEGIERIFLTGGGSCLKGFDQFIEEMLHVPVKRVEWKKDISIAPSINPEELNPYYRLIGSVLDRKDADSAGLRILEKRLSLWARSVTFRRAVVLGLSIFFLSWLGISLRAMQLSGELKRLTRQIENLEPGYRASMRIREFQESIEKAQKLGRVLLVNEPLWQEIFRELSHVLPREVVLSGIQFAPNTMIFQGNVVGVPDERALSKVILAMEGPIFRRVTLVNSQRSQNVVQFTLRAELADSQS